jgi:hypothetical protein
VLCTGLLQAGHEFRPPVGHTAVDGTDALNSEGPIASCTSVDSLGPERPVQVEGADQGRSKLKALGIPRWATWPDSSGRPHAFYTGEPLGGLFR